MGTTIQGLGFRAGLWLAGNEGKEEKMETTTIAIMGHIGLRVLGF